MAEESYRQLSTPDGTTPINEKPIEETNNAPKDAPDGHEYPGTLSLMAIMIALYLAIFLVALVSLPIPIRTYVQEHTNRPPFHRIGPLSLRPFHGLPTISMH